MKIAVLTKAIPSYESSIRIDSSSTWIDESVVNFVVNESDSYALEEALQIKEKLDNGSEVVVVTMGSQDNTSKLFSQSLKDENFDLIFSGLQSDDLGSGQTGVLIGELLGMSTATLGIETDIQDGEIKIKRELESGWFQWVTLPFPASVSIQSGINEPRYPSLKGIMGAKRKELKVVDGQLSDSPKQNFIKLFLPKTEKATEKIEGDVDGIVAKLMDILKNKLRVIA